MGIDNISYNCLTCFIVFNYTIRTSLYLNCMEMLLNQYFDIQSGETNHPRLSCVVLLH